MEVLKHERYNDENLPARFISNEFFTSLLIHLFEITRLMLYM